MARNVSWLETRLPARLRSAQRHELDCSAVAQKSRPARRRAEFWPGVIIGNTNVRRANTGDGTNRGSIHDCSSND